MGRGTEKVKRESERSTHGNLGGGGGVGGGGRRQQEAAWSVEGRGCYSLGRLDAPCPSRGGGGGFTHKAILHFSGCSTRV